MSIIITNVMAAKRKIQFKISLMATVSSSLIRKQSNLQLIVNCVHELVYRDKQVSEALN